MSFQINDGDWWYGTGLSNKIIRLLIDKLAKNCPVKQSFKKRRTSAGDIFQAGLAADRPGRPDKTDNACTSRSQSKLFTDRFSAAKSYFSSRFFK